MKPSTLLDRIVTYIEATVAGLLVVLALLGVADIVLTMVDVARTEGFITPEGITATIDTVLVVFIVIELIRIAIAYMRHRDVVGTVLEAGLVAVVRKLVIFEGGDHVLQNAAAFALLILAVGVTWYLLRRSGLHSTDLGHDA